MARLKITPSEIQKHLSLLEETLHRISACTSEQDDAKLHLSPSSCTWSAAEILAHLRACDDLWSHSIYAMLVQDNPAIPLLDERRWAKITGYADLDFHTSFQAFRLQREELLRVLRNLPEEAWSRTANIGGRTHTIFSQVRRRPCMKKNIANRSSL